MLKVQISLLMLLVIMHSIYLSEGNFWSKYIEPTSAVLSIDTNNQDSCAMRQAPGFICMDCTILARCVFRGNQWDTIALEACDAGQGYYCNAQEQRCSTSPGPCSGPPGGGGENLFLCTSVGVFPDPWNCQNYHMCYPAGPVLLGITIVCGGNQAFNPVTNDCSLTTAHQICRGTQFTCDYVGQIGAWPLNPNIYYICMARTNVVRVLFPQLFRCAVGQVLRNEECVPSNGGGIGGGFNCPRPGLFPDPADCRRYFFCDGNRQSQHINCPTGTYFNTIVLGCVRGYC